MNTTPADHGKLTVIIDTFPPTGEGPEFPQVILAADAGVLRRRISYVEGLPDQLQELVKRTLAPGAQRRDDHTTIYRRVADGHHGEDSLHLRPLLFGPDNEVLAATYERNDQSSVWILPVDLVTDLRSWVIAAFREWHVLYKNRFPGLAEWTSHAAWMTVPELHIVGELESLDIEREA